ncbi:hypothetical protein DL93DRAFT_2163805 [Clavulina sp. PMI_390]|nr:hypothetical protein DL93DRAFT_2163805 [Clavulina sp. PMI_390]
MRHQDSSPPPSPRALCDIPRTEQDHQSVEESGDSRMTEAFAVQAAAAPPVTSENPQHEPQAEAQNARLPDSANGPDRQQSVERVSPDPNGHGPRVVEAGIAEVLAANPDNPSFAHSPTRFLLPRRSVPSKISCSSLSTHITSDVQREDGGTPSRYKFPHPYEHIALPGSSPAVPLPSDDDSKPHLEKSTLYIGSKRSLSPSSQHTGAPLVKKRKLPRPTIVITRATKSLCFPLPTKCLDNNGLPQRQIEKNLKLWTDKILRSLKTEAIKDTQIKDRIFIVECFPPKQPSSTMALPSASTAPSSVPTTPLTKSSLPSHHASMSAQLVPPGARSKLTLPRLGGRPINPVDDDNNLGHNGIKPRVFDGVRPGTLEVQRSPNVSLPLEFLGSIACPPLPSLRVGEATAPRVTAPYASQRQSDPINFAPPPAHQVLPMNSMQIISDPNPSEPRSSRSETPTGLDTWSFRYQDLPILDSTPKLTPSVENTTILSAAYSTSLADDSHADDPVLHSLERPETSSCSALPNFSPSTLRPPGSGSHVSSPSLLSCSTPKPETLRPVAAMPVQILPTQHYHNTRQLIEPGDSCRVLLPVYTGGIRPVEQARGILPRMLVSSRYVISWGRDGQIDFATRGPPGTALSSKPILNQGFGVVTGISKAHASSDDRAILVSNGPLVQASILDFSTDGFDPQHHTSENRPHSLGSTLCVASLPDNTSSDTGIRFLTADHGGKFFRWGFSGETMDFEEIVAPVKAWGVHDMQWATDKSEVWLALNAHSGRGGFLEQWDISQGAARVSGALKLHQNVLNIHEVSPNIILAEVVDTNSQFVLHDWRTPRATGSFGYNNSYDRVAYLRGDVKDSFFARGDTEGMVRLWDIRNASGHQPISISPGDIVTQVAFDRFSNKQHSLISLIDQKEIIFTNLLHV